MAEYCHVVVFFLLVNNMQKKEQHQKLILSHLDQTGLSLKRFSIVHGMFKIVFGKLMKPKAQGFKDFSLLLFVILNKMLLLFQVCTKVNLGLKYHPEQ